MRLTNQIRQDYCDSDAALADYLGSQCFDLLANGETNEDAINLCQNCCVRIAEVFESCVGNTNANEFAQLCVDVVGVCGGPSGPAGGTGGGGDNNPTSGGGGCSSAFINAMAASTVLLMATLAYLLL